MRYKGLKNSKVEKVSPTKNLRSIHHSMRLDVLITNMFGFDMFELNLNELLGVKVSKYWTFLTPQNVTFLLGIIQF